MGEKDVKNGGEELIEGKGKDGEKESWMEYKRLMGHIPR